MKTHCALSRKSDFIFGVMIFCVIGGLIYRGLSALSQQNVLIVFQSKRSLQKPITLAQVEPATDHGGTTSV